MFRPSALSGLDDEVKKHNVFSDEQFDVATIAVGAHQQARNAVWTPPDAGLKPIYMKTIRIMTTAAGVAILLSSPALTGCKREPVERTSAEHQDDEKLTAQVKATFENSPNFKFPDVQVASFKGTVQLSGFVLSDDQKQAAENLAKGVPGAVTVENKISRKP